MTHNRFLSVFLLFGIAAQGSDFPVFVDRDNIRLTYETLRLPQGESMGLVGMNYQVGVGSFGYGGAAVYGAASGERGGFFVGGFEGGVRYPFLFGFEAEAGVFAGGGGGGAAPQGGGLMLRPHVGLSYGTQTLRAGVQLSRVAFPNGDIGSTQAAALVDVPFESFRLDGDYRGGLSGSGISEALGRTLRVAGGGFGIEAQHYEIAGDVRTTGGAAQEPFETVGVRYARTLGGGLSWHLSGAGALGGNSDGYAEIYAGAGWRKPLFETPLSLMAEVSAGMAGGGRVDTGGGAMLRGSAGLAWQIAPQWSAQARGAYVVSDGDFEAAVIGVSLARGFSTLVPSTERSGGWEGEVGHSLWRLRAVHETYTGARRAGGSEESLSGVGMQIDALAGEYGYLYARATGAYEGGAGGYATGSLGGGAEYPLTEYAHLYLQAGLGAAGGGGIDVGGGAIAQGEAGVRLHVLRNADLSLGGGMVRSFSGGLESPTITFGIGYRFGTPGL